MTDKNKYQSLFKYPRFREPLWTAVVAVLVLCVTCFPFRQPGLYGYEPDILYHLNRIEGVRLALLSGRYPAAVYMNFFDGQGYGSPLFYPDLLLLIPAAFRLLGLSPLRAYKLTCALFAVLLTLVCKRSMKLVCGHWEIALAGTALFSMSQFVLADLIVRAGFSSYLSCLFLPPLVAGLHDFFAREGRRVRLIGFSLGGLILTHTLNAFLGIVLTALVFLLMLCAKDGRAAYRDRERMKRLMVTALGTLALTAWYWLPMLEQMTDGVDFVYRHPWADIGAFTQPWEEFFSLTGYFFNIAHVGLGVPVLLFIAARLFAGKPLSADGRFGDLCYFLGLFLLVAMTKALPWELLAKTIFNQLQFTFRIYPFALIFLIFGLLSVFERLLFPRGAEARPEDAPAAGSAWRAGSFLSAVLILSAFFGIVQNRTASTADPEAFHIITEETLTRESGVVGRGEWLPAAYDPEAERTATVMSAGLEIPARIYYKGYRAVLTTAEGDRVRLPVLMGENGLAAVENPAGLSGVVSLDYRRTPCQRIALLLSLGTLCGLCFGKALKKRCAKGVFNIFNQRKEK